MRLSKNFTLAELCVSSKAEQAGIDNDPTPEHLAMMQKYLVPGLEHIRSICGDRAMVLTSAYRNPRVNQLVGGTPTSAHPQGLAADLRVAGLSSLATVKLIAEVMAARQIKIDQLIWESGRNVVHVSFDPRARMMRGHQPGGPGTPINWNFFGRPISARAA